MALPQRSIGNSFIHSTGMDLGDVQTGFTVRTGFYFVNSGNAELLLSFSRNNDYAAFSFPSGIDAPVPIGKGQCKYVEYDFTAIMDSASGPYGATGPAYSGMYDTILDMSAKTRGDGQQDPSGNISMYLTGGTTGIGPHHPYRFLAKTGLYSGNGAPINELRWQHPTSDSGNYYMTHYLTEISNRAPESPEHAEWTGFHSFLSESEYVSTDVDGYTLEYRKFLTPTGFSASQSGNVNSIGNFDGTYLAFGDCYWYRIRSEYADINSANYSTTTGGGLINNVSDWIYASGTSDFNANVPLDVETGLRSGSSSFDTTRIKSRTGPKSALEIYFYQGETDIDLETKFTAELTRRGLSLPDYTANFTGVQFILSKNYSVGASTNANAGITASQILDSNAAETPTVLILNENSSVYGKGGNGGGGGFSDISMNLTAVNKPFVRVGGSISLKPGSASSVVGSDASSAIEIPNDGVDLLEIRKHYSAKIYGGGGGGGGGDSLFVVNFIDFDKLAEWTRPSLSHQEPGLFLVNKIDPLTGFWEMVIDYTPENNLADGKGVLEEGSSDVKVSDLGGLHRAGAGGGGQGFGTSIGGIDIKDSFYSQGKRGTLNGPGLGVTTQDPKSSPGGGGGRFGEKGKSAAVKFGRTLNDFFSSNVSQVGREGKAGGAAGHAIDANANANFSVGEIRSKLITITPNSVAPDGISDLVAWFNSGAGGNVGGSDVLEAVSVDDAAENGDNVRRWLSRNDPANIYLEQATAADQPVFFTGVTEFNGENAISFSPASGPNISHLEGVGIVGSGKVENSMESFEMFYVLHPTGLFENGDFRGLNINKWEAGFHQWSTIGNGQHISNFYSKEGKVIDNTGIDGLKRIIFDDFTTNGYIPLYQPSAWVYNISAKKIGSVLQYEIFNNGRLVHQTKVIGTSFSFLNTPLIGASRVGQAGLVNVGFNGRISEIVIYKKKLVAAERSSVTGYLLNKHLRILGSTGITDYTLSNKADSVNNFAGFLLFNS